MEAKPSSHAIYEFGEFVLNAAELMLYRSGEAVAVPPKAVETLLALIERQGQIVGKDELMEAIWSDTVVEESNLSRYIHVLRSTLGDQEDGSPYIETFRRRGYRFGGNAVAVSGAGQPPLSSAVKLAVVGNPPQTNAPREGKTRKVVTLTDWPRDVPTVGQPALGPNVAQPAERSIVSLLRPGNKLAMSIAALVVIVSAAAAGYFWFLRSTAPPLTDKDVILIADFDNKTGDEIFDGTLRQGLSIQLQQSPFLSLFPDERIQDTLKLMKRRPDEKITRDIAREICLRQALKAYIAGSIYRLGEKYVVTLEAFNAQTSELVASEQQEADAKEQVLKALTSASNNIRGKLGESLPNIRASDLLPFEVTTSSLESLNLFTLARKEARVGNWTQAINLDLKAIELDPEFAMAHRFLAQYYANKRQPDLAAAAAVKAHELRQLAPQFERLQIDQVYYWLGTSEWDKAIEAAETTKAFYPRDYLSHGVLGGIYYSSGRFDKAVEESEAGIKKEGILQFSALAYSLFALGKYDEAQQAVDQQTALGRDDFWIHNLLVQLAFVRGDDRAFENELTLIGNRPFGFWADGHRGNRSLYFGQARAAGKFFENAKIQAVRQGAEGISDMFSRDLVLNNSVLGQCNIAGNSPQVSLAFAICGDLRRARSVLDSLLQQSPNSTLLNGLSKPLVEAAIEYRRGNFVGALEKMGSINDDLESASAFQVQYLRGQVYLKLKNGRDAAAQFQKILDHRGEAPFSPLYPLAYLGRARAQVQTGDILNARLSYEKFLELWKDADADLQPVIEAKWEYARLG